MKMHIALSLAATLAISITPAIDGAIIVENYDTDINDRFQATDDPDQFFLNAFDLSGIGMDSNGRWATLIGPNTILAANHYRPSGTITFYPGNDPSATPVEIGLSGDSLRISDIDGETDLWLARLATVAPASLQVYSYATDTISPAGQSSNFLYKGELAYMTGRSPGSFSTTLDQAFGTNILSNFQENYSTPGLGASLDALELSFDTGTTAYEAAVQTGDSGAPLFLDDGNGGLLLLGINAYLIGPDTAPTGSGVSYVGNNSSLIDSKVAEWAAVPEPLAVLPAGIVALFLAAWRRRR